MTTKKATTTLKSQSQKELFIATAKELGETSEKTFNAVLRRVGKAKVLDKPKKAAKTTK